MAKRVQDDKPARSSDVQAWIDQELSAQDKRHAAIVAEIDALEPVRRKWYQKFLNVIQTQGFNFDGDNRRKISAEEIPEQPDRPDRVVF